MGEGPSFSAPGSAGARNWWPGDQYVDWAGIGFADDDLDELAEHLLRIIQSFVIDPGRPPKTGAKLRHVNALNPSATIFRTVSFTTQRAFCCILGATEYV